MRHVGILPNVRPHIHDTLNAREQPPLARPEKIGHEAVRNHLWLLQLVKEAVRREKSPQRVGYEIVKIHVVILGLMAGPCWLKSNDARPLPEEILCIREIAAARRVRDARYENG